MHIVWKFPPPDVHPAGEQTTEQADVEQTTARMEGC